MAPTADRSSETVIKVEEPAASASQFFDNDERSFNNRSLHGGLLDNESLDDESLDDESLDDEYEYLHGQSLHAQPDISNNEHPDNEPGHDEQVQKNAFMPQNRAKATTLTSQALPSGPNSAANKPRRIVRLRNPKKELLIYTSGQWHGKDRKKGKPGSAGCALIFGSETQRKTKPIGFRLEQRGPSGAIYTNRDAKTAELRALVAALEFKIWATEGWEKVVIATTSAYVHKGITEHIATWTGKGWLQGAKYQGKQMPNFDLWERAIALVNEQAYRGCEVQVCLVTEEDAIDVWTAALMTAKMARASPNLYQSLGNVDITWRPGTDVATVDPGVHQ